MTKIQKSSSINCPPLYSNLFDNMKVLLILLVVFNHLIVTGPAQHNPAYSVLWRMIYFFHMPAFLFVSGYFSKKPQDPVKNVQNLLIPYFLTCFFTYFVIKAFTGEATFSLLTPGSMMWYLLTLFYYKMLIGALSRIRLILPLSIAFGLFIGTMKEFSPFLSMSRTFVFLPFFLLGYFLQPRHIQALRGTFLRFILPIVTVILLWLSSGFMLDHSLSMSFLRGTGSYAACKVETAAGMSFRAWIYFMAFLSIISLLMILPDIRFFFTKWGRTTITVYIMHLIVLEALKKYQPFAYEGLTSGLWILVVSLVTVAILGSAPIKKAYDWFLGTINRILFKPAEQQNRQ